MIETEDIEEFNQDDEREQLVGIFIALMISSIRKTIDSTLKSVSIMIFFIFFILFFTNK